MKASSLRTGLMIAAGMIAPFVTALADPPVELPVVRIEATGRIAEESAAPLHRINLAGEFTVTRTGSTEFSLPVWIHVSGSATPGADYEPIPLLVTIPAGDASFSFPVTAFNDDVPEGIETVVAQVSDCPPEGLAAPCIGLVTDPLNDRDTVFIREDGLTVATVHVTSPDTGDAFPQGAPILIEAVAIHLESYISEIEFWAGTTRIGMSAIYFFVAPPPGTPIHHEFEWTNAPPGEHVLTARARLLDGTSIVSAPVRITAEPGGSNQPPMVAITSPAEGESFPAGAAVPIVVEARDPDGYVPTMEFFADGAKIGEVNVAFLVEPPPNQLQIFEFTWEDPMPGVHVLIARATDNGGGGAPSAPVGIVVAPQDPIPAVGVVARDAFAVEPTPGAPLNTATFRIRRSGPVGDSLQVHYSMAGRAQNGVDYGLLSGIAEIAAGSSAVDVVVEPLADNEEEKFESVIIRVEANPAYHRAHRGRAAAVIADQPWSGGQECRTLGDGLVHFCFPAPSGEFCRIESSGNLLGWSTMLGLVAVDGTVHYIDEMDPENSRKFCRIAPGP